jgi:hypothetical protein
MGNISVERGVPLNDSRWGGGEGPEISLPRPRPRQPGQGERRESSTDVRLDGDEMATDADHGDAGPEEISSGGVHCVRASELVEKRHNPASDHSKGTVDVVADSWYVVPHIDRDVTWNARGELRLIQDHDPQRSL